MPPRLKQCQNCGKPYPAQLQGRFAYICMECSNECDDTYSTVHQYLLNNQEQTSFLVANVEHLAEAAEVPALFLKILLMEGRFVHETSHLDEDYQLKPRCKRCSEALKEDDEDFCEKCSDKLTGRLSSERDDLSGGRWYSAESSREGKRKYGLGRSRD